MKRFFFALGTLAVTSIPGLAAEDPIAVRQLLMESNGAAAAVFGGISKGEIPYTPAVGKAVIYSMSSAAAAFGDYFPEGSLKPDRSEAAPKIWEDMAGFLAEVEKFKAATASAREAAGKASPADVEAFKAAMGPVMGTCKACHESYRVDD